MKRMFTIMMMVFTMMAGLFAYEPKKECVTVKGNKVYYEEAYVVGGTFTKTRKWTYNTKSGKFTYFTAATFEDMWNELLVHRERYDIYLNTAKYKDDTCSTCAFIEKYKSAYENGELNETEMKQYEDIVNLHQSANELKRAIEGKPAHAKTDTKEYWQVSANSEKRNAVNEIPFVTEENWLTLTKEEWNEMLINFCEE